VEKKRGEVAGRFSQLRALKEEKNHAEDDLLEQRQQLDQSVMHSKKLEREVKTKEAEASRLEKKLGILGASSD